MACGFTSWCQPLPPGPRPDLGTPDADDAVHISGGIVEVGHRKRVLAGWDPVPLGSGVDLEHVRTGAEDGLFPAGRTEALQEAGHPRAGPDQSGRALTWLWTLVRLGGVASKGYPER